MTRYAPDLFLAATGLFVVVAVLLLWFLIACLVAFPLGKLLKHCREEAARQAEDLSNEEDSR